MSEELDKFRKDKEELEWVMNTPRKKFGMTLTQYIHYKKPKTVEELQQIISENYLPGLAEIWKIKKEGPHYIGLKIGVKWPSGRIEFSPPEDEVLEIPNEMRLNNNRILLIRRKKHENTRSVQGTNSE